MAVGVVDPHRPAHDEEQIGLVEIDVGEGRIRDVDAGQLIAGGLDRRAEAGNAFMGGVADDERGLHVREPSGGVPKTKTTRS